MPVTVAVAAFLIGALVSLAASWVLVARLERVGERLGLSEALLGLVAALAADAPEITAAVAAMTRRQQGLGAGVVIGSNVFNLAALLGLGAVVAGRIGLHRRVVLLGGILAIWVAAVCVTVVAGLLPPAAGLVLAAGSLVLYALVLGAGPRGLGRLGLPRAWARWLRSAVAEEEAELSEAIRPRPARRRDVIVAAVTLLVVVAASVMMERAAATLGSRFAVPEIVVGGLVLAAVTSLPNAVAAVYLAARGRGAATLSIALNSNALNVIIGLLLPAAVIGLGRPTAPATLVAVWYAGLTVAVLALAYRERGLGRVNGALIIAGYLVFAGSLLAAAYAVPFWPRLAGEAALAVAAVFGARLAFRRRDARPAFRGRDARPAFARREDCRLTLRRDSLLPGWPVGRVWALGVALTLGVAAVDAGLGHRLVLIGLLVIGPCSVLLCGRWAPTGLTGLCAVGLAIVLGIPDGIWGTGTHLAFLAAVATVALVSTGGAALIETRGA